MPTPAGPASQLAHQHAAFQILSVGLSDPFGKRPRRFKPFRQSFFLGSFSVSCAVTSPGQPASTSLHTQLNPKWLNFLVHGRSRRYWLLLRWWYLNMHVRCNINCELELPMVVYSRKSRPGHGRRCLPHVNQQCMNHRVDSDVTHDHMTAVDRAKHSRPNLGVIHEYLHIR